MIVCRVIAYTEIKRRQQPPPSKNILPSSRSDEDSDQSLRK